MARQVTVRCHPFVQDVLVASPGAAIVTGQRVDLPQPADAKPPGNRVAHLLTECDRDDQVLPRRATNSPRRRATYATAAW